MISQRGFFDIENRLQTLSEFGDLLEKLASIIDFEFFRKAIEEVINFSNKEKRRERTIASYKEDMGVCLLIEELF